MDFCCSLNAEAPNMSFKRKNKRVMSFMAPVTTDLDLDILRQFSRVPDEHRYSVAV